MELTDRLRAILDFVEPADTAADIGCDHGMISAALIEEKKARHVFACDISPVSYTHLDVYKRQAIIANGEIVFFFTNQNMNRIFM